jgi:4-hydroxy-3-methylbut-2-enyl diphosphate reductase
METTMTQDRSADRRVSAQAFASTPPTVLSEMESLAPRGKSIPNSGRSATGPTLNGFKVLRAAHLGMCFGVRDAIALAHATAQQQPVTVLGELVHNETVLAELRRRGVRFAGVPNEATTKAVLITAHGTSDRMRAQLRDDGFTVEDSTCPLVHVAHRALRELVTAGFHPVIIGKRDHVEVRGMTGDLDEFDVVLSEEDIQQLQFRSRFGIVSQTTQPIDRVRHFVQLIRSRFPDSEVRFRDTVCQPTKQRQTAAIELAQQCDVVVVIGGANSNNTHELVGTCSRHCARVHHVQRAQDLRAEWFQDAQTVGITAGTSTPDVVIDGVERVLAEMCGAQPGA